MSDRYLSLMRSSFGKQLSALLGLPAPPALQRASGGHLAQPYRGETVLAAAGSQPRQLPALLAALGSGGARVAVDTRHPGLSALKAAAQARGVELSGLGEQERPRAIVYDASGIESVDDLRRLFDLMQPVIGRLAASGRVLVLARTAGERDGPIAQATQAALQGFVRSLAKEVGRRGATANLLVMAPAAGPALDGALRFFLSVHSAFVSGQTLNLDEPATPLAGQPVLSLVDRCAVVTGAARGIGAAIAETLAREGARVIGVDRPQEEEQLARTLQRFGGTPLVLDVTDARAADQLLEHCGKLDVVVHNAGITRDRTLRNLSPAWWDQVLDVNLAAIGRINQRLLDGGLQRGARLVCISSINGIAGAAGQTNYAASKAGLIGLVQASAPLLARQGCAINAVAPGFIETQMVQQMPMLPREFGRRLSSLAQGGLPADVAEAVMFLSSPLAAGVNGRVLRVCGQNFVGA